MTMPNNVLRLENITMQFGGVVAVNNLSMEINEGEIVALIGPNGAGKTTAFNVITGVYQPTNGRVCFNNETIVENFPKGKMKKLYAGENDGVYKNTLIKTPDQITKLGMARTFQNIRLFKSMTVFENVLVAKHLRKTSNVFSATFRVNAAEEKQMREDTMALLKLLGLEDVKDELATSLPYGKQRHLEIARALATNPTLLLLDEPAAGMNPQETADLMDIVRYIRDKFDVTILLIEHDMKFVSGLCDEITVLNFGTVLAQGTPEVALNDPEVVKAYIGG